MSQMRALTDTPPGVSPAQMRGLIDERLRAAGHDPSALYQELEMDSPYVDTHDDVSRTMDTVNLHSHTFYELLFVRGGSLQYLLDARRYRLQAGDIVFIPPNTSHRPLFLDKLVEPYSRFVLWVSPLYAGQLNEAFPQDGLLPAEAFVLRTAATPWQETLGALFRAGVQESYNHQTARARAGEHALRPQAERQELLDALLVYIENHLQDRITLADTARRFLVSESSVNQLFRKRMKVSFYRFVTQRRLIAAKVLLQDGLPAEQISARVGFGDYSSFYRAFKREYGISPAEYRRLQE